MIGAGKSTFCKGLHGIVSDYDEIGNKEKQLEFTLENILKCEKIYHITCYPTQKEREIFDAINAEYIWINTTAAQCRWNIRKRNRKRDTGDLGAVLAANEAILERYLHSDIRFKIIDVFQTDERW